MGGFASRAGLSLAAVILVAGAIVMQILIILSGLNGSPVNKIYFLQADTSSIQSDSRNYNNPARWTYLAICGVVDGKNGNCGPKGAAIPFDPERNFGTSNGVSENLLTDDNYYYLSRTAWAFYLVALFFAACALLVSLAAIIARLGAYFTGLFAFLACFFQALCSALMTAWTVKGRDAFRAGGADAKLGVYAYGFSWGAFAALFLATILFCLGGRMGKDDSSKKSGGYFGRKRSTRSRGSFVDSASERRVGGVKDEYE
ncbi:unnamed protein product [Zymoseptoria tritici ST99CH_3D1]|uniref:Uncharacterized protein n=3 Tax=Zymoseptoria tritici TaxID=1047171 RepID=F9XPS3_ZYMTI|nr:uncharacterized protein MYCGRDRAFT_111606 [Zymoseptoria tritici IPO323]EGP82775.1 hypothetical protein MYCGRDRAFT_111606 [Zymoseptoria tritici IPO323]SMQ56063.1 unnamed protein product [Zymoseptoria tritici ST99CH_3D7]SMR61894.1 unnamed protein product [Zymoseptoria tritici ST99CH_1E4]SMR64396.1 unnamed protein product [Zymoseptoria tritici ST99CH_3D1]